MERVRRVAFLLLRGLDHFAHDLVAALPGDGFEVRAFYVAGPDDLAAALAWADDPARDAVWFEFCWPPFPELIARTEFGDRRVVMRVHRIEAYGTDHAARAPWHKITDAVVVGEDMARRLRAAAPRLVETTALHVVHNGLDLDRYAQATAPDPFRLGWCGWMSLHKNPNLALEVLHRLRAEDPRYALHVATKGGEPVAVDSFAHLVRRMGLSGSVHVTEGLSQSEMPGWHARNGVLLSTSVYESFGYAIAEAAAVGCDLAVLDNTAAAEFWPETVRFATVGEAVRLIQGARPHRWRNYVAERFGLTRQVSVVRALLAQPRAAAPGQGLDMVPVSHGSWRGRFLVRDRADHIQRGVAATGRFYEAEMLEDLRGRLAPGAVFVDVGANVGNHALFAAAVCGARVIAFEPSPALADHCAANLALNGVAGRATLERKGVGARRGRARVVPGPAGNSGMTRLALSRPEDSADATSSAVMAGHDDAEAESVEIVSLDDALDALGYLPTAIKVDVEGMELDVLRGAERTLRLCRPALYVEAAEAASFEAVRAVLRPFGYEPAARFNATPTYLFLARVRACLPKTRTLETA